MNTSKIVRALAVLGCLALVMPGAAMSASFDEGAGGAKDMTEAGKDMHGTKQANSSKKAAPHKAKSSVQKKSDKKHPAKKQSQQRRTDPQHDPMRGN